LKYISSESSWVIGEWELGKENDKTENIEGRVIHINKDGHSLYIGYMHDGKRDGWGVEVPL